MENQFKGKNLSRCVYCEYFGDITLMGLLKLFDDNVWADFSEDTDGLDDEEIQCFRCAKRRQG